MEVAVKRNRIGGIRTLAVAGTLVLSMATADQARGQASTIEVGPNLFNNILNQINTLTQRFQDYAEYTEEARRWYENYQHMQQQLIKLQGLASKIAPMSERLSRRAEDYGMKDSCPGSSGGLSVALLKRWAGIDREGDIGVQQRMVCEYIVLAENAKYNETVDMLENLRKRSGEYGGIQQGRDSAGTSQGNLQANNNDVMRMTAAMQIELDNWEASLMGYDSFIGLLRSHQQQLARAALDGRKEAWGTVVQGAVLKGALETAASRDR